MPGQLSLDAVLRMLRPMFSLSVAVFAGPLDALLSLINAGELDSTAVPVGEIVRQYALYRATGDGSPGETADFIALAARLAFLKSCGLLPRPAPPPPPEEQPPVDMTEILEEYRLFKEAAGALRAREEAGLRSFPRLAQPPSVPAGPGLSQVTLDRLAAIVRDVLARHVAPEQDIVPRESVTVRERLEHLERLLAHEGRVSFTAFIAASRSRLEVVVAFMAVLELIRQGRVEAQQPSPFGDIMILAVQVVVNR